MKDFDVREVMKEIKAKAADRRDVAEDLEMLDRLNVQDFEVGEGQVSGREDVDCRIGDSFKFVKSHRKGLLGRFSNFVLRKIYFVLRTFLGEMIASQEDFNIRVKERIKHGGDSLKKQKLVSDVDSFRREILYPELGIDYVEFENQFRGDNDVIRERQRQYLRFFENRFDVMDIGCGRGEFLELLSEVGAKGFGVELDEKMCEECEKKGIEVYREDALSFLNSRVMDLSSKQLGGVFAAQVVEHLHMDYIVAMLKLCYELMQDDSFVVLETINIKSLSTFTNSVYLDPTHVKPVHPETLKYILESIGFKGVSFIFSGEFSEDEKLKELDSGVPGADVYNSNVRKLNELLFASQDYAVIGQK